jgi:prepilin-type N-terminal cleavage/methylation domain-containing protein
MGNLETKSKSGGKIGNGFTLVEMLVVVSILGVLSALLFPTFARSRESGRRTSCQSNLRQIGLGLLQYVGDWDEKYPNTFFGDLTGADATPWQASGVQGRYKWMDAVFPYVRMEAVFNCPSHALPVTVDGTPYNTYREREGTRYGSYALNGAYFSRPTPDNSTPPCSKWDKGYGVTTAQNPKPAQTVWVTDGNGRH